MTTLNLRIDEKLKKDFKRVCFEKETTLSEVLIQCIKQYITDNEKYLKKEK